MRNSGLISLNEIPLYKKLSRLINAPFLSRWYIVILYSIYMNMSPVGLCSLKSSMEVSSPDCYDLKKLSVLSQSIRSLYNSPYFKNAFSTILIAIWNFKSVSDTMVYTLCLEEVHLNIRNQSGCFCETSFLKAGLYCIENWRSWPPVFNPLPIWSSEINSIKLKPCIYVP